MSSEHSPCVEWHFRATHLPRVHSVALKASADALRAGPFFGHRASLGV
jgi:hypothetical protein